TVEAAMRFTAGQAVGAFSAQAIALAEAAVRALSRTRSNIAAVLLLFLTLAGAGAGMFAFGGLGEKPGGGDRPRAESPPPPDRPRAARYGDPLPPGATSRLGTLRFRTWADRVAFLPGDKVLATIGREAVSFWGVGTGKETRRSVDMPW